VPPNEVGTLSDRVRQLLLGPVDSFEKLEVLLALQGAKGAGLTLPELAARAHLAAEQVELATVGLAEVGLIERAGSDTWRVRGDATAAVGELAAAWTASRPAVLTTMTNRALARIRTAAARRFAEAFRLRRREKDDGDDDDG
jgi:hypothetical protein